MSFNQTHKISDQTLERIVIRVLSRMLHRKQPDGPLLYSPKSKTIVTVKTMLFKQKTISRHFRGGKITRRPAIIRRTPKPANGKKRPRRTRRVRWAPNDIYVYYQ